MIELPLSDISPSHAPPAVIPVGSESDNYSSKKMPYPKSVFFIIATELSERFSYYGMRAVLTIYMRNVLQFSDDQATTLYHTFLLLCYGLPVFWGIIADSFLGKYRTIWIVSILFAIGNFTLTISSIPPLQLPPIPLAIVGLLLMALGTGGMKPCVAPFGGEQFVLPQQNKLLQQFFSVFFFAVTIGNMVATVITPIFRRDVHCLDMDSCYPLAFGVPAMIMLVAVGVFISGRSLYTIKNPEGNMLVKVGRCMTHAILNRKKSGEVKGHWLNYAEDKFDTTLINDIKLLLRVLVYYLPIPMFFALYEQLGSRWTLQATRMSGQIGYSSFTIKPDQMQVSNAIFMFIFIPVFQFIIYPLFGKCNLLKRPLQRMCIGGFLASASFLVAGMVETQIERNHYTPPSLSETHLKFVNTLPCPVSSPDEGLNYIVIEAENTLIIPLMNMHHLKIALTLNETCNTFGTTGLGIRNTRWTGEVNLLKDSLQSVFIYAQDGSLMTSVSKVPEDFKKANDGNPKIRIAVIGVIPKNKDASRFLLMPNGNQPENYYSIKGTEDNNFTFTAPTEVPPRVYEVYSNIIQSPIDIVIPTEHNTTWGYLGRVELLPGGSYLLVAHPSYDRNSTNVKVQRVIIESPNEIHMLWLIPQYLLMAWAEILFIVSGMEFSFTQAPNSMKSVLQSLWHLMNAFGNIIVILSAQTEHVHSQSMEFFGFSAAMFVDTVVFCLLAMRYKYVGTASKEKVLKDSNDNKQET